MDGLEDLRVLEVELPVPEMTREQRQAIAGLAERVAGGEIEEVTMEQRLQIADLFAKVVDFNIENFDDNFDDELKMEAISTLGALALNEGMEIAREEVFVLLEILEIMLKVTESMEAEVVGGVDVVEIQAWIQFQVEFARSALG